MSKREFLMLAKNIEKRPPYNMWMSEKLDGVRCLWDGGISRDMPAVQVPWANVEKHGRYTERIIATGLWTRYGQAIQAPDWFLDQLPRIPLDGELTMGRNTFQPTISCVKRLIPTEEWRKIKYMVFDIAPLDVIVSDGRLTNTNFKKTLIGANDWLLANGYIKRKNGYFAHNYRELEDILVNPIVERVINTPLSALDGIARKQLQEKMDFVLASGGEGLMLRAPFSIWEPSRTVNLLKVKGLNDMEGTVIGYKWGSEGVGNKLVGLMGSLTLMLENGVTFDLSGFTDQERGMAWTAKFEHIGTPITDYGAENQGQVVDKLRAHNPTFPVGAKVTFKYREFTDTGVPKEARYFRKAEKL